MHWCIPGPGVLQSIAPGLLSRHSLLQLRSAAASPCSLSAPREHDVNMTNITKDPEEHKLPQRHSLKKKKVIPCSYSDWPLTVVLRSSASTRGFVQLHQLNVKTIDEKKEKKCFNSRDLFINSSSPRKRKGAFFQVNSIKVYWVLFLRIEKIPEKRS